jgi:hypothetical protein
MRVGWKYGLAIVFGAGLLAVAAGWVVTMASPPFAPGDRQFEGPGDPVRGQVLTWVQQHRRRSLQYQRKDKGGRIRTAASTTNRSVGPTGVGARREAAAPATDINKRAEQFPSRGAGQGAAKT